MIGLGGNLGDVRRSFSVAISALSARFGTPRVSRLYETLPLGPAQPMFLNAAVLVWVSIDLHELLGILHGIEAEALRERQQRWGPRTLDLDVLWAGTTTLDSFNLTVPHPGLRERGFALLPLLDLAPHAIDPIDSRKYSELISDEFLASTRLVSDQRWWEHSTSL